MVSRCSFNNIDLSLNDTLMKVFVNFKQIYTIHLIGNIGLQKNNIVSQINQKYTQQDNF